MLNMYVKHIIVFRTMPFMNMLNDFIPMLSDINRSFPVMRVLMLSGIYATTCTYVFMNTVMYL